MTRDHSNKPRPLVNAIAAEVFAQAHPGLQVCNPMINKGLKPLIPRMDNCNLLLKKCMFIGNHFVKMIMMVA